MTWVWIRRLLSGPTDEEISARSQAAGGPPYPIPQHDIHPPTPLVTRSPSIRDEPGLSWDQVVAESEAVLLAAEHRRADLIRADLTPPAAGRLPITRAYPPPPTDKDTTVNDPTSNSPRPPGITSAEATERARTLGEELRATRVGSDQPVTANPSEYMVDVEFMPRKADPVTDSGVHTAQPEQSTVNVTCPTCKGLGHMQRTVSELLRESIALIPPDGGQTVIREFYRRLLTAAPDLAPLFPPDLITAAVDDTASPGRLQRDRLLQALAALAELYGTSPADRQRLDTALRAYGRSHAAFTRPDGTVRGATVEEYLVVKQALMDTLHTAARDAWLAEYDSAWAEAYDYAMVVMLHEQLTGGMTFPRQARAAMPSPRPRRDA